MTPSGSGSTLLSGLNVSNDAQPDDTNRQGGLYVSDTSVENERPPAAAASDVVIISGEDRPRPTSSSALPTTSTTSTTRKVQEDEAQQVLHTRVNPVLSWPTVVDSGMGGAQQVQRTRVIPW